MTRKDIEQLLRLHGFETKREEQWYKLGLKQGLEIADNEPASPWISVKSYFPRNFEELISPDDRRYTKYVIGLDCRGRIVLTRMKKYNDFSGNWYWDGVEPEYWMPIPKLPKEYFTIQEKVYN